MHATWSRVGRPPEIPVTGQRKSVKILGAIELWRARFHYRRDTAFNAGTYLAFLKQLARRYRRQGGDADPGQRFLPQGCRGLGLVPVQPSLAGSSPAAAVLAGVESHRAALAAHAPHGNSQSLLCGRSRTAGHADKSLRRDAVSPCRHSLLPEAFLLTLYVPLFMRTCIDAAERAGITPLRARRLHAFAYLADVLSPVWNLQPFEGKILKVEGGPHYPDLQRELNRLAVLGIVLISQLEYGSRDSSGPLVDAYYAMNLSSPKPRGFIARARGARMLRRSLIPVILRSTPS